MFIIVHRPFHLVQHYTSINFKNVPTKPDVDVDFSITCSVPSKVGTDI